MARTLRDLIRACGHAGTSGQSFRNHVTGAVTGVHMSQYIVSAWQLNNLPAPEFDYDSGTVFNLTVQFVEGSMAQYIRLMGTNVISVSLIDTAFGRSVSSSHNVTSATTAPLDITVTSRYNPSASVGAVSHFQGQSLGYTPPDFDPHPVQFDASGAGGPGTGKEVVTVHVSYPVDIANFNPPLVSEFTVSMRDRAAELSDFEIQWSSDGVNNDLGSGNSIIVNQSASGQDISVWQRWRFVGTSVWSAWTIFTFDDPRAGV